MHAFDLLLQPLKKINFKFQHDQSARWYTHTEDYTNKEYNPSQVFIDFINSNEPGLVSRLGTAELHAVLTYLLKNDKSKSFIKKFSIYNKGLMPEFWWGSQANYELYQHAGFFPVTDKNLNAFSKLYLDNIKEIDVLCSWLTGENYIKDYMVNLKKSVWIFSVEPYLQQNPWTAALHGKKVLVIHPFEESIKYQYSRRKHLFENPDVLPDFDLQTIKAVQSIKGNKTPYSSWFNALEFLKNEINKKDFDIALIAAGSYGLPLGAYIKGCGKKALHLGGFLQIIFGIRGNRWETSPIHKKLINEYWKFPYKSEYPDNYKKVDSGVYW